MGDWKKEAMSAAAADTEAPAGDRRPSVVAQRMRRLRARRRQLWTRVVAIEVNARDCGALFAKGYFRPDENAREHAALAIRRLLNTLHDA